MGYKQNLGPLQRAGYDKDATSPFRQDQDTSSGVELEEFIGTGKRTSVAKDDIKKVIENQRQYDVSTEAVAQNLAEIDSLTRVAQGNQKEAQMLYGHKYSSNKPLTKSNHKQGQYGLAGHDFARGVNRSEEYKARLTQYDKLREEARKTQGPRPTL